VEDTAALSLVPRAAVLEGEGLVTVLGSAPTWGLEWCYGNADWAVREAILYCKKSSVRPLKSRR
jgi:hypothetical protein